MFLVRRCHGVRGQRDMPGEKPYLPTDRSAVRWTENVCRNTFGHLRHSCSGRPRELLGLS